MQATFTKEPLFSEQAYSVLKDMILEMKISPKECLSESKLASLVGMSRTPVREALKKLENEAIIVSSGKNGYFLNIPTIKEMKDLYELRAILEIGAVKFALPRIDCNRLEDFEKKFLSFKNKTKSSDGKDFDFVKLGQEFHFFIVESTENKELMGLVKTIYERIEISRAYSYDKRRDEAVDEHLEIVYALQEGNPEKCQKAVEEHLKNAFETLIKIL